MVSRATDSKGASARICELYCISGDEIIAYLKKTVVPRINYMYYRNVSNKDRCAEDFRDDSAQISPVRFL